MGLKSMADRLFSRDKGGATDSGSATTSVPVVPSTLLAHLDGTVVRLEDVSDQTFASGALGPGAAIEPTVGKLYAPADGKITVAFPTGHAIGIRTEDGLEILMHVGFDTVELDGKFFNPVVSKGQEIKRGDLLVEFDIEGISSEGYSLTTPLVITNAKAAVSSTEHAAEASAGQTIEHGAPLLELKITQQ